MATELELNVINNQPSGIHTAAHLQEFVHVQFLPAFYLYPLRILRVLRHRDIQPQPLSCLCNTVCNFIGTEMAGVRICQTALHQTAASVL
jgi:hypothetical protein